MLGLNSHITVYIIFLDSWESRSSELKPHTSRRGDANDRKIGRSF